MQIRFITEPEDLKAAYRALMVGTAGENRGVPDSILEVSHDDGRIRGFIGIREISKAEAYLQYGETVEEARGSAISCRMWAQVMPALHDRYEHLYMMVSNENTAMLRLALGGDWIIHGYHQALDGEGFVELLHTRHLPPRFQKSKWRR